MILIDTRGLAVGLILSLCITTVISALFAQHLGSQHLIDPLLQAASAARFNRRVAEPEYWLAGWMFFWFVPSLSLFFGKSKLRLFVGTELEIDRLSSEFDEVGRDDVDR